MTALMARVNAVDTEAITAQARTVKFGPAVLNLIAFLLIGVGKLTYRSTRGLWLGGVWMTLAVREGWRQGKANEQRRKMEAFARRTARE